MKPSIKTRIQKYSSTTPSMPAKASVCAAGRLPGSSASCYRDSDLRALAERFNQVKGAHEAAITVSKPGKSLHRELTNRLGADEASWYETLRMIQLAQRFRPKMPSSWSSNAKEWLTNVDIDACMKQYEERWPAFEFLGTMPVDFAERVAPSGRCVSREDLCTFNPHARKHKTQFGMVINMDRHDQEGSHWCALYCDVNSRARNFGIWYYNSVACPPPEPIHAFMKRIATQVQNRRFSVRHNTVRRQFESTECGVFSIVFLLYMLDGRHAFADVCQLMRKDVDMNRLRAMLYRPVQQTPSHSRSHVGRRPSL